MPPMIDSTYSPAPEGIVGTNVPCSDAGRIVECQGGAHKDAEAHDAHQRLHHFLEAAVPPEQHEDEPEEAVEHAAPRLRNPALRQVGDAEARRVGQSRRHGNRPEHEVYEKVEFHPCRQVLGPPFERGFSRGELPARNAFVQNKLEKRAHRDRPEQDDPIARPADRGGHDVAGADARRGHDESRPRKLQETQ